MNHDNSLTSAALLEQLVYVDTFMPEIDDPSQLDDILAAELSAFADDSFVFPDEEKPTNSSNNNNNGDEDSNGHNNGDHDAMIDRFNQINGSFSQLTNNNQDSNQNNNLGSRPGVKTFSTLQQSSFNTGISNILSPLSTLTNNHSSHPSLSESLQQHQIPQQSQQQSLGSGNDLLTNLPKVPVPPGAQSSLIAAGLSQTQIDALAALIAQHQAPESGSTTVGTPSQQINTSNITTTSLAQLDQLVKRENVPGGLSLGSNNNNGSSFRTNSISTSQLNKTENTSPLSSSNNTPAANGNSGRRGSARHESSGSGGEVDIDKRKRNTEASARFRIKKKLKEQELERSVRELNELTITLEKKIQTLEMENKLLRNLVVEKGEQRNNDELEQLRKRAKTNNQGNNGSFEEFREV